MHSTHRAPGFDPFLHDVRGAEVLEDAAGLGLATQRLVGREVLVAGDGGRVEVAVMSGPQSLRLSGPCPFAEGEPIAITDHNGLRYTGLRTAVATFRDTAGGAVIRLRAPSVAVFYPGRRHVRLSGDLGARIELDCEGGPIDARALDISMGGVGLSVSREDGFVIGETFDVCLHLDDGVLRLPARVRSAVVFDDEVRLGVEFAAHAPVERLSRRLHAALHARQAA